MFLNLFLSFLGKFVLHVFGIFFGGVIDLIIGFCDLIASLSAFGTSIFLTGKLGTFPLVCHEIDLALIATIEPGDTVFGWGFPL